MNAYPNLILICAILGLAGCSSGVGAKWYAPATWFSGRAAAKADKADARVVIAKENAVIAAQKAVHETKEALLTVPESRSTVIAVQSNENAVALLDQANGPLTASQILGIREQVQRLLSDNAEIRAKAEKERAASQEDINAISSKLDSAVRDSRIANDKLRVAFERENALANELRASRALAWILGSVAVLVAAGYLYLRLTIGGLPTALGRSLSSLRASSPDVAEKLTNALDINLSPAEQALIRLMTAKSTQ